MNILIYSKDKAKGESFESKFRQLCPKEAFDFTITVENDTATLPEKIKEENFNVFFIYLNDLDDIKTAKAILKISEKSFINFVSNNEQLVFEAFQCHPFMFLREAYLDQELMKTMYEIRYIIFKKRAVKNFSIHGNIVSIDLMKVSYAEIVGNYLYLFEEDRTTKIRQTIAESEHEWCRLGFVRVHMSYLVNCKFIEEYSNKSILLFDGTEIPVSRSHSKETRRFIRAYMLEYQKNEP